MTLDHPSLPIFNEMPLLSPVLLVVLGRHWTMIVLIHIMTLLHLHLHLSVTTLHQLLHLGHCRSEHLYLLPAVPLATTMHLQTSEDSFALSKL